MEMDPGATKNTDVPNKIFFPYLYFEHYKKTFQIQIFKNENVFFSSLFWPQPKLL